MSHVLQPVLAMNVNIDEMLSYSSIAFTLAGKVSKSVHILDTSPEVVTADAAQIVTQTTIDEG